VETLVKTRNIALPSQTKRNLMISLAQPIPEPLAVWSRRLSLFALAIIGVVLILHRFGQIATPVALNVVAAGFAITILAVVIGVVASISIWVRGRSGAGAAAAGIVLGGALWIWPLAYVSPYLNLPRINDISTDLASVPRFGMLARVRGPGANSATYPGERYAREQQVAYPDLRAMVVDRPVDEVFDLVDKVVRGRRGLGWKVLTEEQPSIRPPKAGIIEATERTLILGFIDDIVIRVTGTETESRIDIRSASRFGRHDFGANASRIRRFMREMQGRLESTTPGAIAGRGGVRAGVAKAGGDLKRPLERLPAKAAAKNAPSLAPQDARRAPAQKATPRG
jgi:hypothetical protein